MPAAAGEPGGAKRELPPWLRLLAAAAGAAPDRGVPGAAQAPLFAAVAAEDVQVPSWIIVLHFRAGMEGLHSSPTLCIWPSCSRCHWHDS